MNRIGVILKEKNKTQLWLSERLDKSFNMVNSYVQQRRQPRLAVLFEIAEILEVDVRDLIEVKHQKSIGKNEVANV